MEAMERERVIHWTRHGGHGERFEFVFVGKREPSEERDAFS